MGIIVDIVIVAFILLSVFLGYKKGLISLGIKLVTFILALVITLILYRPIANLVINVTYIDETIENAIIDNVNEFIGSNETDDITNELIESAKNGMLPQAARTLSVNIVYGGVILILLVASRIALKFITALANLIAKLPILNQFNKAGGIIYGFLRGVLIIYVLLLVIGLFGTINPKNELQQMVDESHIAKVMSEKNILNVFFK